LDISIQIRLQRTNQRYKAKGTYLLEEEAEHTRCLYELALERAALEAFEGRYEAEELGKWWSKHKS